MFAAHSAARRLDISGMENASLFRQCAMICALMMLFIQVGMKARSLCLRIENWKPLLKDFWLGLREDERAAHIPGWAGIAISWRLSRDSARDGR
jgi:hypothetical protein